MSPKAVVDTDSLGELEKALFKLESVPDQLRDEVWPCIARCKERLTRRIKSAKNRGDFAEALRLQVVENELSRVEDDLRLTLARLYTTYSDTIPRARARLDRMIKDIEGYQHDANALKSFVQVFGVGVALVAADAAMWSYGQKVRRSAVKRAWSEDRWLLYLTGRGTRSYSLTEIKRLTVQKSLKGYEGHHIKNVSRYPLQAGKSDNIALVKNKREHLAAHRGSFQNNSYGRLIKRKSEIAKWLQAHSQ